MGIFGIIIAVALGIALGPVIFSLLAGLGYLIVGLVVLLLLGIWWGVHEGLLVGWLVEGALLVGSLALIVLAAAAGSLLVIALWSIFVAALREIRQDGSVLSRLVVLSLGICFCSYPIAVIAGDPLGVWLWAFFILLGVFGTAVALGDPEKYLRTKSQKLDLSWFERLGFTVVLFFLAHLVNVIVWSSVGWEGGGF